MAADSVAREGRGGRAWVGRRSAAPPPNPASTHPSSRSSNTCMHPPAQLVEQHLPACTQPPGHTTPACTQPPTWSHNTCSAPTPPAGQATPAYTHPPARSHTPACTHPPGHKIIPCLHQASHPPLKQGLYKRSHRPGQLLDTAWVVALIPRTNQIFRQFGVRTCLRGGQGQRAERV